MVNLLRPWRAFFAYRLTPLLTGLACMLCNACGDSAPQEPRPGAVAEGDGARPADARRGQALMVAAAEVRGDFEMLGHVSSS